MKKSLVMCGVAALALASCTKNEVLDVNDGNAIKFNAFVNNNTRVANEVGSNDLKKFNVYGYHGDGISDYTNALVYGSSEDGWTIDGVAYWKANEAYEFAAYSDGNNSLDNANVSFANKVLTISNYTVGANDLIAAQTSVASAETIDKYPKSVGFTFNHLLSQIKFTFKNGDTRDYKMTISDLNIAAKQKGSVEYSIGAESNPQIVWNSTEDGKYTVTGIDDIADGALNSPKATESIFVMPQENDALKVTFTVTLTDAAGGQIAKGNFEAPLDIDNQTQNSVWAPGYRYNYTATINGSDVPVDPEKPDVTPIKIEFSVDAVNGWQNATDDPTTPTPVDPQQ